MLAMLRLPGDPLIHFLAIGAGLFIVLSWLSDDTDPRQITVSAEQVRAVLQTTLVGDQSTRTRSELEALVQPLIRDEVLYREALALGLDVEDDQVRTRLIEKMRYVSEDLADPEPADESQLREFFAADPARFVVPEAVTFEHVYFSPRQRGDAIAQDAEAALAALRDGRDAMASGDSTPLGEQFEQATRDRLSILFGDAMTDALFAAEPGEWLGPLESDFGLHLVRVVERSSARNREFDEVADEVREAWAADRREQQNAETWARLRERYIVDVEWPEELVPAD